MEQIAERDQPVEDNVIVELRGPDGALKERREVHNLIPTVGKEALAKLVKEGTTRPGWMAIGTGATAAASGDTALQTELDRNALAEISVSGKVVTMKAEWLAADGTGSITEAGLFSASSGGTLFAHSVFGVITKGSEDVLSITWKITFE